jgi:iron complex transport system permease protein
MQALFRNPLAGPGIIGTTAGASLGAVLVLTSGLAARSMLYMPLAAILGALASLALVIAVARRSSELPATTLLLAGVAIAALLNALIAWQLSRVWEEDLDVARRLSFWMLGGIADRSWQHSLIVLPCLLAGVLLAVWHHRDLDLLLEGDEHAAALGVEVEATKHDLLLASAILVGGAVAVSGSIGFVGLIAPHMMRLCCGPTHRALLPLATLAGATLLLAADLLARTLVAPRELHLGVVTALLGAPFFLMLLIRKRGDPC